MKRITMLVALCFVAVVLVGLAWIPRTSASSGSTVVASQPWERGDQYLYQRFFAHVTRISGQAEEADRLGMNSSYLRNYLPRLAQLQVSQAALINEVAAELAASLAKYDANAAQVRKQWHVLVQTRRQNHEPIPAIPAEVLALKAGHDALVLRARDRLRAGLGDAEFARLDALVREKAPWGRATANGAQAQPPADGKPAVLADRTLYKRLFRLAAHYKSKAEEERGLGLTELADGIQTILQRQAGLSDEQASILDRVSSEYMKELDTYKPQAEAARLVYTRLSLDIMARDGNTGPTPELTSARAAFTTIIAQRDSAADRAIVRLREAFGAEDFGRLDAFVKQRMQRSSSNGTVDGAAVQEVAQ